jgi:dienelactone hydrolase
MPVGSVVEYWKPSLVVNGDERCTREKCSLSGWLFKHSDQPMQPAVVFVHGSGSKKDVTGNCEMISYYLANGYVVYMPYMRGVGDSSPSCSGVLPGAGFKNTGVYIGDESDSDSHSPLDYMKKEAGDLQFALDKLTALPSSIEQKHLVDPMKIALTGHSFGGAIVLLAASMSLKPQPAVAVDISGGVLSWNDHWSDFLKAAAGNHQMPIFFLQAANESHIGPNHIESTEIPFDAANGGGNGPPAEMAVFSGFDIPQSYKDEFCTKIKPYHCAHLFFVQDHTQVMRWIQNVHDFMLQNGVK